MIHSRCAESQQQDGVERSHVAASAASAFESHVFASATADEEHRRGRFADPIPSPQHDGCSTVSVACHSVAAATALPEFGVGAGVVRGVRARDGGEKGCIVESGRVGEE